MRLVQEVDRFGELFTYRRVRLLVFWGEVGVRLTQNDTLGGTFASGLRERHFLKKMHLAYAKRHLLRKNSIWLKRDDTF